MDAATRELAFHKLMNNISVDYETGCWNWTRSRMGGGTGYGALYLPIRQQRSAHRVAWELFRGEIPDGHVICHRCDNRGCCNPDHLFIGTPADNVADMVAKGRHIHGERTVTAKVRAQDVRIIREMAQAGMTSKAIGEKFGISFQQVRRIVRRERWSHVS